MYYYAEKVFKLNEFEAWGGALDIIKKIEDNGITYQAEDYIVDNFFRCDKVTDTDINDFIWYQMGDKFIEDTKEQLDDEMLEYFEFTGVLQGMLYAVENDDKLELVTDKMEEETCIICYNDLDRTRIWTEDSRLHVVNKYIEQVGVYKVNGDQLFLESKIGRAHV